MKIGTDEASLDCILFLDEDQTPEEGLMEELTEKNDDAIIIPERSLNRNFIGRLMDYKRTCLEESVRNKPIPEIPVIPRFYRKEILLKAFANLSSKTILNVEQHEDSILYSEIGRAHV